MTQESIHSVNNEIHLERFDQSLTDNFYTSIHAIKNINDSSRCKLQKKYDSLDKLKLRMADAIDNKFLMDGTPDFFVYFKDQIVGVFEFHPLCENDHIEIGYWLYSECRRKGIMSSIFPIMINFAKDNFSKSKILATTSIDNHPSQKLLEKVKFIKTGRVLEFKDDFGDIVKEFEYIYTI